MNIKAVHRNLMMSIILTSCVTAFAQDGLELNVSTVRGTALEERGKQQLLRLVEEYAVDRWIYTRDVVIQTRGLVRSHPVLSLNTQYIQDDHAQLAVFLHEQFHWFLVDKRDWRDEAIEELRLLYPDVPEYYEGGARTEESTYLHLVVCSLEFDAVRTLLGEDEARRVISDKTVYRWIYRTILEDYDRLHDVMAKHGVLLP